MNPGLAKMLAVCIASLTALSAHCAISRKPVVQPLLRGIGAELDPGFPYYADRSPASIASEVAVNGYQRVHYVVTADTAIKGDLVNAFHSEGLPVWYVTFGHVAYATWDFPSNWQDWRMVLRASPGNDFTRLCMNDPGYRAFKRQRIANVMARYAFDGVEVVEPFWPDWPGPQKDTYGCLCDDCRAAFLQDYPEEQDIPEFTNKSSPRYYKKVPVLYNKWMDFRVNSINRFLNEVLADVRHKPIMTWTLAQEGTDAPALAREAQGMDVASMALNVRPDAICFQTNWMDWMQPNLPPDYFTRYQPFVDLLKSADPAMPYTFQVDTGSVPSAQRTMNWLLAADRQARKMCALGTVNYEFFITKSMYEEAPKLMQVRPRVGGILLVFHKRVDAGRAADKTNYAVVDGNGQNLTITGAKADGNMVLLGVRGIQAGVPYTVTAEEIRDTPSRWLVPNQPAHTVHNVRKTFTLSQLS